MERSDVLPSRYRDPERIARGGMGVIYRAEDGLLGRTVAVKVLAEPYADDDGIRRRFTHEALAAARLSNAPSTITIFDVGEHEGRPYIVMEYLVGGSLADRIAAEGAQPPGRALAWLEQAAAALDAAHTQNIVHRDVKPANLLLDDEGGVRVADFGVASAAGLDSFTAAGTVLGTAGYLAPEQARGERAGPASDRYALAVVAFELLTGARPYERDSTAAEAAAHVNAPVPSATALNPELPRALEGVFGRALAKEPSSRYESCAELVAALREAFDSAAGGTTVWHAPRRSRLPLALGLLAGAAILLAGAALGLSLIDDEEPRAGTTEPSPQTVRETVTLEATTVVQTVTTAPPPEEEEEAEPPTASPSELNDEGFRLMQAGEFEAAQPLLEQAVAARTADLTEAYASYNLAFTRLSLGRCDGVLELLARSEELQGERKEISRLRREAERGCNGRGNENDD
ncbi:MAG TPA: serine/threonine-protein kinase [Gaiellaceae bacterium]|nr:serine/threonine-protein kinase [Gaiellaceae bacterium]